MSVVSASNEGVRVEERPCCILCGHQGVLLHKDLRDRFYSAPGDWALLRCPVDGLVWLNPQPVAQDIGKLYPGYCTHTDPRLPSTAQAGTRQRLKQAILASAFGYSELAEGPAHRLLGWICSLISPLRDAVGGAVMWLDGSWRGQLLDIGCGNGSLVAPLRDLGWSVTGVEIDPVPAALAREHLGLMVYESTVEEACLESESFDVVTMHHVIEHLPDPLGTLRECWRVLKPGGKLVVITPNVGSLAYRVFGEAWSYLDPPRHLTLFDCDTLAGCAEQAGFQATSVRTSTRHASLVWSDSRSIERTGVHPHERPRRWQLVLTLGGLAFLGMESALGIITRDAGEELVFVATR